jgi:hypothetical protein
LGVGGVGEGGGTGGCGVRRDPSRLLSWCVAADAARCVCVCVCVLPMAHPPPPPSPLQPPHPCSSYNNITKASQLLGNANYHMFKEGIRPMWEDESNKAGGKWTLPMPKREGGLDKAWLYTVRHIGVRDSGLLRQPAAVYPPPRSPACRRLPASPDPFSALPQPHRCWPASGSCLRTGMRCAARSCA